MEANLTILVIICITAIIVIVCKSYEKNKQIESLEYDIEFEKEESKKELKKIGVQFIKIEESYIKVVDDWKKGYDELKEELKKEKARVARLKSSRNDYKRQRDESNKRIQESVVLITKLSINCKDKQIIEEADDFIFNK